MPYINSRIAPEKPIFVIGLDCDRQTTMLHPLDWQMDILKRADIICGGEPVLSYLRGSRNLAGRLLPLKPPLGPMVDSLDKLRKEGLQIVVLADGDPLFFGIGTSIESRLGPEALRVFPAISSLAAAFGRLGRPWEGVTCLSLHGRSSLDELDRAACHARPLCILPDKDFPPDAIAAHLLDRGQGCYRTEIFENMGASNEKRFSLSLEECAKSHFRNLLTMILLPGSDAKVPYCGIRPGELHGEKYAGITGRGAALGLLQIRHDETVWIVGARSGYLAVEAANLAPGGTVYAIEKDWEKALNIQLNREKLGVSNLEIVLGRAPGCLKKLPTPERIYIGCDLSAPRSSSLLTALCLKLAPGGLVGGSFDKLESFLFLECFFDDLAWSMEYRQISIFDPIIKSDMCVLSDRRVYHLLTARKPAHLQARV